MNNHCIILCTTKDLESAKIIAKALLAEKLAACVNLIPQLTSIYTWENELCEDNECLMIIKSLTQHFDSLKNKIVELHTYTIPEVILFDIKDGHFPYLDWISSSCSK